MKLVHLVGYITKKFVTMHGHRNVKLTSYSWLIIRLNDNSKTSRIQLQCANCRRYRPGIRFVKITGGYMSLALLGSSEEQDCSAPRSVISLCLAFPSVAQVTGSKVNI